jgi:hypothetical protein
VQPVVRAEPNVGHQKENDELAVDDDWRGSRFSSCWYQRDTPPSRAFAEQIGRAGMIVLIVAYVYGISLPPNRNCDSDHDFNFLSLTRA